MITVEADPQWIGDINAHDTPGNLWAASDAESAMTSLLFRPCLGLQHAAVRASAPRASRRVAMTAPLLAAAIGLLPSLGVQARPPFARPVAPGELFCLGDVDVRAPRSEGWSLRSDPPASTIEFGRVGEHADSWVALAGLRRVREGTGREEFVEIVRSNTQWESQPPSRFTELRSPAYRQLERHGQFCVRVSTRLQDNQARVGPGVEPVPMETIELSCLQGSRGVVLWMGFSHRGPRIHPQFEALADSFFAGVEYRGPEKRPER